MGAVVSASRKQVTRPLKTFNVEDRAMKVISRDKPTPAPPHPSMRKVMEDIMKDPSKMKTGRTDPKLLQNLSSVYVKSAGHNPQIVRRNLPEERTPPVEALFGYEEPKVVPPGRASLRQLIEMISENASDSEANTAEVLAKKYNLDVVHVANILQHCKTLLMYNPPKAESLVDQAKHPLRKLQDGIDNLKENKPKKS